MRVSPLGNTTGLTRDRGNLRMMSGVDQNFETYLGQTEESGA